MSQIQPCEHCGQPLDGAATSCSQCGRARSSPAPRREGDEPTFVPARLDEVLDGKWRLERKLGEGGMGSVYLAHDLQLDRKVAIKLLSRAYTDDAELVARFEREARLTASLEHPNIVPIYAVGRYQTRPFIVMKNLEGSTLSDVLRQQGKLSLEDTLAMMRQLCAGLDFIHQKKFIHRDIKTGNIFVGPDGLATILDFGILRSTNRSDSLTRTGMVMGTPHYMSPEQALGARDFDHRADLYALAIVLFECLSGNVPFDGESDLSVVQLQAHAAPPDLVERAPHVPRAVADVVTKALSKRPEDRYPTAVELFLAFEEAYLASSPAHSAGIPQRTPIPFPAVGPLSGGYRRATPAPQLAPELGTAPGTTVAERPPRRSHTALLLVAFVALGGVGTAGYVGFTKKTVIATPPPVAVRPPETEPAPAPITEPDLDPTPLPQGPAPTARVAPKTTRRREPAGRGELNVITTFKGEPYWAQVSINGQRKGNTPLWLELPPGTHRIRVDRTGFQSVERQIKIASGRSAVLRIPLVP